MKILHVLPSLTLAYGGPVTNTVAASHAIQELGAEATIYSVDSGEIPQAGQHRPAHPEDLPSNLEGIDVRLFKSRFPHRFANSPDLRRGLRENLSRFDVVHIHQLFLYPQFAAWWEATRANVPYVVSPRGSLDPYLRERGKLRKKVTDILWQRRMLDSASALHLTSEDEKRLLLDLGIRAPHVVVPNGIDISSFEVLPSPDKFREKFLTNSDGLLILNHGRISHKKGIDILIEAFAEVHQVFPNAHLVLVGPDDERLAPRLTDQARSLGIDAAVHFVGALRGADLLEALSAADIWVLPSHTENFGNAVVEAMAAAKPVITSPYVNIAPEAHEANALIMVDNKPALVAQAILRYLSNPIERLELGQRARSYAWKYDWSTVGREYLRMYSSAVIRHRGSKHG